MLGGWHLSFLVLLKSFDEIPGKSYVKLLISVRVQNICVVEFSHTLVDLAG